MQIAPSMLACDFSQIKKEVEKISKAKADMLHLDVMDGHFVPNISFGPAVIKAMRHFSDIFFDVHLMISHPLRYIDDYKKAGADNITFHVECNDDINDVISKIHSHKLKASLSLKPKTDIEKIYPYLDKLYMVLIMTVEPGFGGQKFIPEMMGKVDKLKCEIKRRDLNTLVQIDGGVDEYTVKIANSHGVDVCVAGTSVFKAEDSANFISKLKNCE